MGYATTIDWDFCFYIKRDRTNEKWALTTLRQIQNNLSTFPKMDEIKDIPDELTLLEWIQSIIESEFGDT